MNLSKSIIYSILILSFSIGIPHYIAEYVHLEILNSDLVDYYFYIFNDLSVVYIIIPFFSIELFRYLYLKRLNKNVLLDSVANIVTIFAF